MGEDDKPLFFSALVRAAASLLLCLKRLPTPIVEMTCRYEDGKKLFYLMAMS